MKPIPKAVRLWSSAVITSSIIPGLVLFHVCHLKFLITEMLTYSVTQFVTMLPLCSRSLHKGKLSVWNPSPALTFVIFNPLILPPGPFEVLHKTFTAGAFLLKPRVIRQSLQIGWFVRQLWHMGINILRSVAVILQGLQSCVKDLWNVTGAIWICL